MSQKSLKETLYEQQQGCCFWCGQKMLPLSAGAGLPLSPTVDHVLPRATNIDPTDHTNCRASCFACNNQRSAFNPGAYENTKRSQQTQIDGLKKLVVTQEKEIKRLTDVILTRLEQPWWKRIFLLFLRQGAL